jgi:hypothetical protein
MGGFAVGGLVGGGILMDGLGGCESWMGGLALAWMGGLTVGCLDGGGAISGAEASVGGGGEACTGRLVVGGGEAWVGRLALGVGGLSGGAREP